MRIARTCIMSLAALLTASLSLVPVAQAQASSLFSQLEAPVADALHQVGVAGDTGYALEEATDRHLRDMGHTPNQEAEAIALAWATEAALGRVEFVSGAGKGTLGADRGEGQIYQLTTEQAQERITWLDREANPATETYGFGTAVLNGTPGTIYLAEFFLGA